MLNVILSKAVDNISEQTKKTLYLKWGYIKDKEYYFDKQTLIYLSIAFGIIIPFSIYLYFINLFLKKEVSRRKIAENKLLLYNQDLEKRVQEELEKRTKQELYMLEQDKLAQMGNMMNMIAHQWKQPLNTLSLLTQSIKVKNAKSKLDDEYIEYFNKNTKKQIQEMTKVINDFMVFFKPKQDRKSALDQIIEYTISIVEPAFLASGIKIVYNNSISKEVICVDDTLGQVIINILNNAKDALVENNIQQKKIELQLFENDNKTIITIEDNAGGIEKEIIQEIFNPYFSTKNQGNGMGLGLYMSKMIVENYNKGTLKVSNSTKGALFTIEILNCK